MGQPCRSSASGDLLRVAAEMREGAVAEAQHGDRERGPAGAPAGRGSPWRRPARSRRPRWRRGRSGARPRRWAGERSFMAATWTRWPAPTGPPPGWTAKPQVELPSLPTRMTVSASSAAPAGDARAPDPAPPPDHGAGDAEAREPPAAAEAEQEAEDPGAAPGMEHDDHLRDAVRQGGRARRRGPAR